jgi:anaerobic magnesium-protoporphyrin IX monomethyl ester cyclase
MWTFSWPLVREIVHEIKARFPDKPLVCGGEHFSALPELSMEQAPIDFIVLGEGEEGAVEVFDGIALGARSRGASTGRTCRASWFRDADGKPLRSAQVARPQEGRRRHRLARVGSVRHRGLQRATSSSTASTTAPRCRSSPRAAAPTSAPTALRPTCGRRVVCTRREGRRRRDRALHKVYGATNFPFQDLTAILKKNWIVEFCNELLNRNIKDNWQFPSGTRCEVIDDEVATCCNEDRRRSLALAPESGSERTRKLIRSG